MFVLPKSTTAMNGENFSMMWIVVDVYSEQYETQFDYSQLTQQKG